ADGRLALGPIVLGPTPDTLARRLTGDEEARVGSHAGELRELQPERVDRDPVSRVDAALVAGTGQAAAAVATPPHPAVRSDKNFVGVRTEREGVEVGVLPPAQVLPVLAAIVRAVDPTRADAVIELATCVHDIGIGRVDLDDVVVEALAATVVEHAVVGACKASSRQLLPARRLVVRSPEARWLVVATVVDDVAADVQDGVLPRRVGQA